MQAKNTLTKFDSFLSVLPNGHCQASLTSTSPCRSNSSPQGTMVVNESEKGKFHFRIEGIRSRFPTLSQLP
jgi:hypothetical protein